jgi:hypothetical protein
MHTAYSTITRTIPVPTQKKGVVRRKEIEGLRRSHSEKKAQIINMKNILFKTCPKKIILNIKKKARKCMKL